MSLNQGYGLLGSIGGDWLNQCDPREQQRSLSMDWANGMLGRMDEQQRAANASIMDQIQQQAERATQLRRFQDVAAHKQEQTKGDDEMVTKEYLEFEKGQIEAKTRRSVARTYAAAVIVVAAMLFGTVSWVYRDGPPQASRAER